MSGSRSRENSTVDQALTAFIRARKLNKNKLFADKMVTRSAKPQGFIWQSKDKQRYLYDTVRAPNTKVNTYSNDYTKENFKCIAHGLGEDVAKDDYEGSDSQLKMEENITGDLQDNLLLAQDYRVAQKAMDTDLFTDTGLIKVIASDKRWNLPAATILADIHEAIAMGEDDNGINLNAIMLNKKLLRIIGADGDIAERVEHIMKKSNMFDEWVKTKSLTFQALLNIINQGTDGIEHIFLGEETVNIAEHALDDTGLSGTNVQIVPNKFLIFRYESDYNVDDRNSNTFITIIKPEGELGEYAVEDWYEKKTQTYHWEVNNYADEHIIREDAAVLIDTPI
jgi:hypothetical protein